MLRVLAHDDLRWPMGAKIRNLEMDGESFATVLLEIVRQGECMKRYIEIEDGKVVSTTLLIIADGQLVKNLEDPTPSDIWIELVSPDRD